MKKLMLGAGLILAMSSNVMAMPITPSYVGNLDLGYETFFLNDLGGTATNSFFEIVLEEAGYADTNSFGVYQASNGAGVGTLGAANYLQLFDGSDGVNEKAKLGWDLITDTLTLSKSSGGGIFTDVALGGLSIDHNGFGFYLDNGHGDTFFSETALNADGIDHMVAFQVGAPDAFVLAWEDLSGGGDFDYNDFVLYADDINPVAPSAVPAPAPLALMGLGLIGLAGIKGKKKADARKKA